VTMKNAVFWGIMPCCTCNKRRFEGTYHLHHQGVLRSLFQLLVTANVVPNSPILVTLITEALRSSEISVRTRVTRRSIAEDGILRSHRLESLKSYIALTGWTL
jgi:hypothetical protein